MASETNPDGLLALKLEQGGGFGWDLFQLNLPGGWSAPIDITTFESERTLVLACNAPVLHLTETTASRTHHYQKLDLVGALRCGLLELVDKDTQEIVHLPRDGEEPPVVGRIEIPPRESPRNRQKKITLAVDTTAQIWKEVLRPTNTYNVRFSKSGGDAWCYYPDAPDQRLPIRREADAVHFTVYDDPPAPTCTATLTVDPSVCHRSGTPPFKFVTEITLDAASAAFHGPVTVDMYHTAFNSGDLNDHSGLGWNLGGMNCADQLVRCVDAETGEAVEFSRVYLCFDEDPHEFPDDDFFVELWPGKPWRHEYALEKSDHSSIGGLGCLDAGRKYKVSLSAGGFGRWMYGRKEDLLRGTTEEKEERWAPGPRGRPAILLHQVNEPVEFEVVE